MKLAWMSRRLSRDIWGTLGSLRRHLILPTIRILLGSAIALLWLRLVDSCARTNSPCSAIRISDVIKWILIHLVVSIVDTFPTTWVNQFALDLSRCLPLTLFQLLLFTILRVAISTVIFYDVEVLFLNFIFFLQRVYFSLLYDFLSWLFFFVEIFIGIVLLYHLLTSGRNGLIMHIINWTINRARCCLWSFRHSITNDVLILLLS